MALKRKRPVHKQDNADNKLHKFQSFSERIERLNIDVLRKVRPVIPDSGVEEDDTYAFSYFSESVKKWRDLNLCSTFTEFYYKVLSLSESLPQVIHHQDKIMSLLEEYINKQDQLSLHSLLDMLVQFARDLGEDFHSKYWVRSVTLLSTSVNHAEFSAIEAAFNTLSWLLKYLARPLVSNLSSTFDQLAPLLGKARQKQYVRRFTSEAFAFLLRRVKQPTEIVKVMLADVDDNEEYLEAIVNVFVESMKAPGRSLHSKALALFNAIIQNVLSLGRESDRIALKRVLEQILYNTNKEHFSPIIDDIVKLFNGDAEELAIDLLLLCCMAKGGSKINNWSSLTTALINVLHTSGFDSKRKCQLAAILVARSDPVTSKATTQQVFEIVQRGGEKRIGIFCQLVGKFNESYFQKWVLEEFVKYVNVTDHEMFDDIVLNLISFQQSSLLTPSSDQKDGNGRLNGFRVFKDSIFVKTLMTSLRDTDSENADSPKTWLNFQILELLGLHTSLGNAFIDELLLKILRNSNEGKADIIGILLSLCSVSTNTDEIFELLAPQAEQYASNIVFLEGLEKLLLKTPIRTQQTPFQKIADQLQQNLSYPSHLIRSTSLRIFKHVMNITRPSANDLLEAMLAIENTPRTVENIRSISLAMRRLSTLSSPEYDKILIAFCFGLLTVNFAPLWSDACAALKVISGRSGMQVWELAYFNLTSESNEESETITEKGVSDVTSESASDQIWAESELDFPSRLERLYATAIARSSPDPHTSTRSQSLRVLLEVPQLAEQHSRDLVPLFLSLEAPSSETSIRWSRKDRISLLTLFTKFTNPRALYKTADVRSTLYTILHNGDPKLQLLALDSILTWKDVELTTYRDSLHNLLDDRKFREELTNLIHVDADDSPIREEHRQGLMEVVMRILYGNALIRQGEEGKRSAILSVLANLVAEETRIFIDLALLPFEGTRGTLEKSGDEYRLIMENLEHQVDERKMLGFVTMVQSLVKALGLGIEPYMHDLVEALIVCMWKSKLSSAAVDDFDERETEFATLDDTNTKASRSIRKTSMKVFNLLISTCPQFEWECYTSLVYQEFVSFKLEALADENLQSPSTQLQFFETLSQHRQTVLQLSHQPRIISAILRCLENCAASISIFETVLNIFSNVYKFSEDSDIGTRVKEQIILPSLTNLLEHITIILTNDQFQQVVNTRHALDLITDVLRFSAPFVETALHAERLIEPLISLLDKPGNLVNEKTKGGLLESVLNLLPLCGDFRQDAKSFDDRLLALSKLFGIFNNRIARVILCQAIDIFATRDSSMKEVADLVTDLNAYDTRRLDTPDFDRRLAAFAKLNETLHDNLNTRAWTPILYNMLYFIRDPEEMSLRTGAAFSLERFFTAARKSNLSPEYTQLLSVAVFPAIKKGLKHSVEMVRKEFSGVLDSLVKNCGEWSPITDLKVLLFDGDEEANFFNNIYHIQQHRQLRAITRLSKAAADGMLKAANIEQIFVPMLEMFSLDPAENAHNVAAEATRGIGVLSGALGWKSYRQLVKRYLSMMKAGDEKERAVVRTVCVIVENAAKVAATRASRGVENKMNDEVETDPTVAEDDILVQTVVNVFYPPMLQYLHHHEESTIGLRVPVAIALVKILHSLPHKYLASKLPAVLSDVCHILRSRSQEARDTCRKTLNEIMMLLGSRFFSFILKELKTALSRGYQLHVLGYTVHSLLAHLPANYADLDGCVKDIVDVLIDDVFGVTGAEKESEGYTTSMKEVKGTKSYDSFEVLASITSIGSMSSLLAPLKTFLYEMGSVKDGRKMSEVLRRIQLGILRSKGSVPSEVLDFSVSLFQSIQAEMAKAASNNEPISNQFIVDLTVRRKFEVNHFKANAPKLLRFALDTISALLKKYEYLVSEDKLHDLVPVLGDCLVSDVDELRIPALRLLGRMISLPIASIEEGLEVFVERALQYVKESPLTKSELCQASLKFLSLLIRARKTFVLRENVLIYLLERIRPDLEEPDRQGVSFSLIRAILARRLVVSEVYDIMTEVSNIMITNQSRSVRDTTRALYLQFLMDYPQGRDRLKKQISFLVKNLQYEYETGRQSVMEILHQVISKFNNELLQPILLDLFVGLLLPLTNDESSTCQEMASRLIQSIIESADDERSKSIRTMLRLWARQTEKAPLLNASLHIYGIMLEHGASRTDDVDLCVECVMEIILKSGDDDRTKSLWEVTEQALQLLTKLVKTVPAQTYSADKEDFWIIIRKLLMCEHVSIRLVSSRLFGTLFSRAEALSKGELKVESLILRVPHLTALARHFLEQIKSVESTSDTSLQAVRNLIFLGRHFYQTGCPLPKTKTTDKGHQTEEQYCFKWLTSRIAAEIRYDKIVAEHVGRARKLFVQWMVAMISVMNPEDLLQDAQPFIASLSRFTEDGPVASILKSSTKETQEIAEEGLKLVQTKLGITAYLENFNTVRKDVLSKRQERKMKRSIEVVTDPEQAAKKKIRQHDKARVNRKRKIEEFRSRRAAYGR